MILLYQIELTWGEAERGGGNRNFTIFAVQHDYI
jgi:hypothetical protein